jgi:hypothetical protein
MISLKATIIEKFFRFVMMKCGKTIKRVKRTIKSQRAFNVPRYFYKIADV